MLSCDVVFERIDVLELDPLVFMLDGVELDCEDFDVTDVGFEELELEEWLVVRLLDKLLEEPVVEWLLWLLGWLFVEEDLAELTDWVLEPVD